MKEFEFFLVPIQHQNLLWVGRTNGQNFGVTLSGAWCVEEKLSGESIELSSSHMMVPLLPVLTEDAQKFRSHLALIANANPEFADALLNFPGSDLVSHVLNTSYSDFWPEKALQWIESKAFTFVNLKDVLGVAKQNKAFSQPLRQRIERVVKSL
jgi:hypothetical protein